MQVLKYIFSFILLVLIQVFVLNNIQFSGYVNPYLYILFIITLPMSVKVEWSMLLAFLLGLSVDIFSNTIGMHAFACVLIAFLRPIIIKFFCSADTLKNLGEVNVRSIGTSSFVKYVVAMTLVHHIALFIIDTLSFGSFWFLFFRILYSSIFTILLILGIEMFKKSR